MPLFKGKSKAAFSRNVKTEMDAGKPQKQSLAIAYAMKGRGKAYGGKMCADGGDISKGFNGALGAPGIQSSIKNLTGKPKMMAKGGMLTTDGYQSQCNADCNYPCEVHPQAEYDEADYDKDRPAKQDAMAMSEDGRKLNQHGEEEEGPQGPWMAEGGMLTDSGYQSDDHEDDMVGRVMAQRQRMYSKGGRVANDTEIEAGFMPNEFDDLHLRDDLESSYTGANSGDERSSDGEDERRRDMVRRVMASRAKRAGRNPQPA